MSGRQSSPKSRCVSRWCLFQPSHAHHVVTSSASYVRKGLSPRELGSMTSITRLAFTPALAAVRLCTRARPSSRAAADGPRSLMVRFAIYCAITWLLIPICALSSHSRCRQSPRRHLVRYESYGDYLHGMWRSSRTRLQRRGFPYPQYVQLQAVHVAN